MARRNRDIIPMFSRAYSKDSARTNVSVFGDDGVGYAGESNTEASGDV